MVFWRGMECKFIMTTQISNEGKKLILLGANWCPVTKTAKELFENIKKEESAFDYEYIDIDSAKGKELVNRFSITDVPKIIFQDKIIFYGLPVKDKLLQVFKEATRNSARH